MYLDIYTEYEINHFEFYCGIYYVPSRQHAGQRNQVPLFNLLPDQIQAIACDCRKWLTVYGVQTPPFSCHRNLSPSPIPILTPWFMFFPNRDFCLLHRGYSKFFPRGIDFYGVVGPPHRTSNFSEARQ